MMRLMKLCHLKDNKKISKIISVALLYFVSNSGWAATDSIAYNARVVECIKKYGENNDECFGELNKKSENRLNEAYNDKLKEIAEFDFTRWWMGTQEQKDRMLEAYKQNQQDWIKYRDNYCELISVPEQGTHLLSEAILSCMVNMNALRINQIEMIKP